MTRIRIFIDQKILKDTLARFYRKVWGITNSHYICGKVIKKYIFSFIRTKPRSYFDVPKQTLSDWILVRWWKELIDEQRPGPMEWLVLKPFK